MKSSIKFKDVLFISSVLLCFGASAYGLYLETFARNGTRNGDRVGTITYKNRYAEQKAGGSSLWASLKQNSPVYNNDTIRTGADSIAVIHFDNKTEIELNEESMILISFAGNKSSIDLEGGSVVVGGTDAKNTVSLKTDDGAITVSGGEIRVKKTAEGITVKAKSGSAIVKTAPDAMPVTIEEHAVYDISSATVQEPSVVLTEPASRGVFITDANKYEVIFTWDVTETAARPNGYTLLVSADQQFSDILFRKEGATSGISAMLPKGKYYWRIEGFDEESDFTILKGAPPALIAPINARIPIIEPECPVLFSWSKASDSSLFRVEISQKDTPDVILFSRTTDQRSIIIDIPDAGDYLWKATALLGPTQIPFPSKASSFTVTKGTLEAPSLPVKIETNTFAISEGNPILSWEPVPGADRYEARISAGTNDENVVFNATGTANFLKPTKALKDGQYSVSVRARSGALASPWTAPCELEILPIRPIELLSPLPDNAKPTVGESVFFRWKDLNGGSQYRLIVSSKPNLSAIIFNDIVPGQSREMSLPANVSGDFSWTVTLLDSSSKPISESVSGTFSVVEKTSTPTPRFPVRGQELDLNSLDNLTFEWEKETGNIVYTIRLYRMTGGMRSPVGQWETEENRLVLADLSSLALDSFSWELSSRKEISDGTTLTSDPVSSYFKIVQKKPLAIPKIKKMASRGEY